MCLPVSVHIYVSIHVSVHMSTHMTMHTSKLIYLSIHMLRASKHAQPGTCMQGLELTELVEGKDFNARLWDAVGKVQGRARPVLCRAVCA